MNPYYATILVTLAGSLAGYGCANGTAYESPPAARCVRKLESLGRAVSAYYAKNGCLPATSMSATGEAVSWRVLVTPYFRYQLRPGFNYRFDEPWNSEHNRAQCEYLAGSMICPLESESVDYPFVSYLMLIRAANGGRATDEHVLLPPDAIIVVESVGCGVEYAEPKDIDVDALFSGSSPFGLGKLNSPHPYTVRALRADGSVVEIPKSIKEPDLRKLLDGTQVNGSEGFKCRLRSTTR